jgi:type II secretory pathway component PulJ
LKQQINPLVAVIVILAVVAGAGWLIYQSTQPRMINLPYKSQAQRIEESKQAAQAMRMSMPAAGKAQKGKPTSHATDDAKRNSQPDRSPESTPKSL